MKWDLWRPMYERIVERLDLDEGADRRSAEILNELIVESDPTELEGLIRESECIVFGAGPSLEEDLRRMSQAGWLDKVLISADGATSAVMEHELPDVIVTDLDGDVEDQMEAWRQGAWMVVHAHGDNVDEIERVVPRVYERIIGTIQVDEPAQLHNFGGFTDGDRAAFMPHELGASKIYLAGMDLGNEIGEYSGRTETKRKLIKLDICGSLLSCLVREFKANVVNVTSSGEDIPDIPREQIS